MTILPIQKPEEQKQQSLVLLPAIGTPVEFIYLYEKRYIGVMEAVNEVHATFTLTGGKSSIAHVMD